MYKDSGCKQYYSFKYNFDHVRSTGTHHCTNSVSFKIRIQNLSCCSSTCTGTNLPSARPAVIKEVGGFPLACDSRTAGKRLLCSTQPASWEFDSLQGQQRHRPIMSAQPPEPTEKTALLGGNEQGQPPVYTPASQPPSAPPPYSDVPGSQKPPQVVAGTTATTVVITQPVVTQPVVFRDYPVFIVDSQGRQIQTVLEFRSGSKTHLICFILCLVGLFLFWPALCFCWVPYVADSTKDVYHINPTDGTVVGVYRRM